MLRSQWQVLPPPSIPQWFLEAVKSYTASEGGYAAHLLWQRGIQNPEKLAGYLILERYQPTSPFDFGQEMKRAVQRLHQARSKGERVTIWGDFDADGITSTSVLWEGLGQFFPQQLQLTYYIPNRFTESHGLNLEGIDRLVSQGTQLIVTCDTGSTNLAEIEYASSLGIDLIITDHHTLPEERPPVVSIINPRYFAPTHPLYHLSGVAVAYKLVEAMYLTFPEVPQQPLEELLDLVAIGLIADLVELKGDCRYLAQKGIQQLQKQSSLVTAKRPGIARLLELCKRNGDRPTDISFGLGPRINAVSRIQGDASFCIELLTSRDTARCEQLAQETELANTRRKSLQKEVTLQVKQKLSQLDLSTTSVIVLEDPQWQSGVLGLVAGQIAQEYGRPTILLSAGTEITDRLARGSARSVNNIDLYELVQSQAYLLHRFGGHPFAAGLSLPVDNLPLFQDGINQQLRRQGADMTAMAPLITVDLIVTVAELGKALFRELKLLEPYGMGNPIPKLLVQNCWFDKLWQENDKDLRGKKVQYIKTSFKIWDNSITEGFPGVWWGHYKDEVPQEQPCDAIVELDYNPFRKRFEVRLIAIQSQAQTLYTNHLYQTDSLLDFRNSASLPSFLSSPSSILLDTCPTTWDEIQIAYRQAIANDKKLALAYLPPEPISPQDIWKQLIGIAKYLSRTHECTTIQQLQQKLNLSDRTLALGLQALLTIGFQNHQELVTIRYTYTAKTRSEADSAIETFLEAVAEEQFQRQYFYQVPLATLTDMLSQTTICF